jgi:hypothetical protein
MAPPDRGEGTWQRFLHSRFAPLLTHALLAALTACLLTLLYFAPTWLIIIPGILLTQRIGILLHEYLHGIPFRRYRDNLAVYGFFDGTMLMFGLMELFRGTHLAHHHWLNEEGDSAVRSARPTRLGTRVLGWVAGLEAVQHLKYLWEALHGRQPYVRLRRVAMGAALSALCVLFWWQIGRADIPLTLIALNAFTVLVPVSFRGAVEHHGPPGSPGFANEYRVWITLFHLNRHVHHHEDMRCPWYLLTYRTPDPLSARHYFTHWFRVYIKRDYVLMQPMPAEKLHPQDVPEI